MIGIIYLSGTAGLRANYQPTGVTKAPRFLFAIEDRGRKPLKSPSAVLVAHGRLYVGGLGSVSMFANNGRWLGDFSLSLGETGAYVPYAHDMALDSDGRIYVTVGPFSAVMVFDKKGRVQSGFPPPGQDTGSAQADVAPLTNPIGIYHDQVKNSILVSDVSDHTVKEYAPSGRFLSQLGEPGDKPGKFTYPNGIVTDAQGVVYVADSNNGRVQKFKDGRFEEFLEPPSDRPFVRPKALVIDKLGRIHVLDTLKGMVYVFAADGRFLFNYGGESETEGRIASPTDIAIDLDTGQIFIADRGSNRVLVWAN